MTCLGRSLWYTHIVVLEKNHLILITSLVHGMLVECGHKEQLFSVV